MRQIFKIFSVLLLPLSVSCVHKTLMPEVPPVSKNGVVAVSFDWSDATGSPDPDQLHMYMYSQNGQPAVKRLSPQGESVKQESGSYDAFVLTPGNVWKLDAFKTATITTNEVDVLSPLGLKAETAPAEPVRAVPVPIWYGTVSPLVVPEGETGASQVFKMQDAFIHFYVTFSNVKHTDQIVAASLALSGVSSGFLPAVGVPVDDAVTIPFAASIAGGTVKGDALSFGHCAGNSAYSHTVSLYLLFSDGSLKVFQKNVSDQVMGQKAEKDIYIYVDDEIATEVLMDFAFGDAGTGIDSLLPGGQIDVS